MKNVLGAVALQICCKSFGEGVSTTEIDSCPSDQQVDCGPANCMAHGEGTADCTKQCTDPHKGKCLCKDKHDGWPGYTLLHFSDNLKLCAEKNPIVFEALKVRTHDEDTITVNRKCAIANRDGVFEVKSSPDADVCFTDDGKNARKNSDDKHTFSWNGPESSPCSDDRLVKIQSSYFCFGYKYPPRALQEGTTAMSVLYKCCKTNDDSCSDDDSGSTSPILVSTKQEMYNFSDAMRRQGTSYEPHAKNFDQIGDSTRVMVDTKFKGYDEVCTDHDGRAQVKGLAFCQGADCSSGTQ